MLVGITKRRDPDMRRISDSEASVDRALGNDELDAQTSIDGSFQQDLFGKQYVQEALESRDVMDQQGDAQEDQIAEDTTPELDSTPALVLSDHCGPQGAVGAWAPPPHPPGPQDLPRDYGPDGAAGGLSQSTLFRRLIGTQGPS